MGEYGPGWWRLHGLRLSSERRGRSSRMRRAAPSNRTPSDEAVVARCAALKTAFWRALGLHLALGLHAAAQRAHHRVRVVVRLGPRGGLLAGRHAVAHARVEDLAEAVRLCDRDEHQGEDAPADYQDLRL